MKPHVWLDGHDAPENEYGGVRTSSLRVYWSSVEVVQKQS